MFSTLAQSFFIIDKWFQWKKYSASNFVSGPKLKEMGIYCLYQRIFDPNLGILTRNYIKVLFCVFSAVLQFLPFNFSIDDGSQLEKYSASNFTKGP